MLVGTQKGGTQKVSHRIYVFFGSFLIKWDKTAPSFITVEYV